VTGDRAFARRTTLADVAAEAGVSRATASRALAESPLVHPATRERVGSAARRLGFQPNHLARSLRRGATMAVGLVVPDVASAFYAAALKAAQETVEAAGYHVLVVNTERAAHREREALATLRAHRVDGLIIATYGGYEDLGVPAVFFDNVPVGDGLSAVAMDNAGGLALLVEHLAHVHGHQRIAYLGPPETMSDGLLQGVGHERLEGFRAAVGRAGLPLPPEYVRTGDLAAPDELAMGLARDLLRLERPPTAVVAGTDTLVFGLLRALRELGARVPDDVAVVSFDEPIHADLIDPPVTSLDRHDRELGRRAAEMLLDRLGDGPGPEPAVLRVPLALHARRSCGCPLSPGSGGRDRHDASRTRKGA
jgi:DNA-binding LacI/PurR family transcriptional regulator